MRLLLDTHALLWFLGGDARLPAAARNAIVAGQADVYVSVISLWEIIIKTTLGKLDLIVPFEEIVSVYLPQQQISVLPVQAAHLIELQHLPLHHRDPFDRMLVAQARADGLTLVSRDPQLASYDVSVRWQ